MKYKITTNGIANGVAPFEIETHENPFIATISEFIKMLDARGLEIPTDLICKNGKEEIVLEYSYEENEDLKEKVQLIFKIIKL